MNSNSNSRTISLGAEIISTDAPVYFIADLASNHDGDIEKAKDLIYLAKESGANAAKFQHFMAKDIVSDYGFKQLGKKFSHQSSWQESIYDTYEKYQCHLEWTNELIDTCQKADITFMTTPYNFNAVEVLSDIVPAFKVGSGDITWIEFIENIARKNRPVLVSTGASSMQDVERAVNSVLEINQDLILMQCNTNYTIDKKNFLYINLNVLKTYAKKWPDMILGLSDHTPGHATVLGAVALGARVIEKHFTDDNNRSGPDHAFSMNPVTWRNMVEVTRELELSLGCEVKKIEDNEHDTAILQRRCIRLKKNKLAGEIIKYEDLEFLRPAPNNALAPYRHSEVLEKVLKTNKKRGEAILFEDLILE